MSAARCIAEKSGALRDKIGDNYLHVLAEEGWDQSRPAAFLATSPLHSNPTAPRAAALPVIHSGRTLG